MNGIHEVTGSIPVWSTSFASLSQRTQTVLSHAVQNDVLTASPSWVFVRLRIRYPSNLFALDVVYRHQWPLAPLICCLERWIY
jgi:hypothetical protein